MKPEQRMLTYAQLKELKWFCDNVTGVRMDFYAVLDLVNKFDTRIERLEVTCRTIEKFIATFEEKAP